MSNIIMGQVWPLDLPSTEKLVLVALADNANDDGIGWPPYKDRVKRDGTRSLGLERKTGLSRRGLQTTLASLEKKGLILRNERPGKGVTYLVLPELNAPKDNKELRPEGAHDVRRASDAPAQEVRGRGAPGAPKPSITVNEVSNETSTRARALLGEAWDSFVAYRKAKKKPLNELAATRLLNQLEGWTDLDPVEVIAWTMLRGWEAPYRPKDYDLEANPQLRRKVEASAPAARAFKPVATESEEATRIREKLWRLAEPDAYDRWLATVGIAVKDGTVTVYAPGKLEATHLRSDGRIDGWLRAACLGVLGRDNWQRIEILGLEPVA